MSTFTAPPWRMNLNTVFHVSECRHIYKYRVSQHPQSGGFQDLVRRMTHTRSRVRFEVRIRPSRESQRQEQEMAGHIASTVRKQRDECWCSALLSVQSRTPALPHSSKEGGCRTAPVTGDRKAGGRMKCQSFDVNHPSCTCWCHRRPSWMCL